MPNQILLVRTGGPADFRKTITNASIINMPRLSFVEHKNSTNLFKYIQKCNFIWLELPIYVQHFSCEKENNLTHPFNYILIFA
jgi:hypothetical protein